MELRLDLLPRTVELVRCGEGAAFKYVDERLLPEELTVVETSDWLNVVDAIKSLAIRGAPAIGVAGAAALALWARHPHSAQTFAEAAEIVSHARPTAVNLSWAVNKCLARCAGVGKESIPDALFSLAKQLEEDDERTNRAIGDHGSSLIEDGANVLTHCNAGSLATCFYGTALGVVYSAVQQGKNIHVFADETRPLGQGARLTAWELSRAGVPVTLICDNMAGSLMSSGAIDAVIVGADRIARNGDVANKIGTYSVAVLAKANNIPFYVAAPSSTFDPSTPNGSEIIIEQRSPREVLAQEISGVDVYNPAFDITPASLISKVVTEIGALSPDELNSCL